MEKRKKTAESSVDTAVYCYMGPNLSDLMKNAGKSSCEYISGGAVFSGRSVFGHLHRILSEEEYAAVSSMIIPVSKLAECREGLKSGVGVWASRYRKIETVFKKK